MPLVVLRKERRSRRGINRVGRVERQEESEDGAGTFRCMTESDREHAAMAVYDSAADPEPDSISFVTLGGEERLEDPGQRVRGQPCRVAWRFIVVGKAVALVADVDRPLPSGKKAHRRGMAFA